MPGSVFQRRLACPGGLTPHSGAGGGVRRLLEQTAFQQSPWKPRSVCAGVSAGWTPRRQVLRPEPAPARGVGAPAHRPCPVFPNLRLCQQHTRGLLTERGIFLTALGLHCFVGVFSSFGCGGVFFLWSSGFTVGASLGAEQGLQAPELRKLWGATSRSCGAWV